MAYVAPADFSTKTRKPWTQGLILDESAGDATYLEGVITLIQERIDDELRDTFEPPSPDNDITLAVNAYGGRRLYLPRRIRSVTSVSTRDENGVLTAEASSLWRAASSVSAGEFGDIPYDYLEVIPGQSLSTGGWPVGTQTVQVVGKFGWSSTPDDIKRLAALLVYDYVKPMSANLRRTDRLQTDQATITFTTPEQDDTGILEADRIMRRYRREPILVG